MALNDVFRFLDLLSEIRLLIYEHLLADRYEFPELMLCSLSERFVRGQIWKKAPIRALLQVNRQIRKEGMAQLGKTVFAMDVAYVDFILDVLLDFSQDFLPVIESRHLALRALAQSRISQTLEELEIGV